jgi:AraC-like DNA-binding protein
MREAVMELTVCTWRELAVAVCDPRCTVRSLRDLAGYQHRPQGWSSSDWRRESAMHTLYLVDAGVIRLGAAPARVVGSGTALLVGADLGGPVVFEPGVRFHELWIEVRRGARFLAAEPRSLVVGDALHLRPLFELVADDLLAAGDLDEAALRQGLALLITRLTRPVPTVARGIGLDAGRRADLLRWTREHLRQNPEPADLARVTGLSHDYFTRAFRATFGRPPRAWLVAERVRGAARELCETPDPVAVVAARFGFLDPSHFGRIFRHVLGVPPLVWRQGGSAGPLTARRPPRSLSEIGS